MPGLFSCAGVTGSVGVLRHVQMAGLIESSMLASHIGSACLHHPDWQVHEATTVTAPALVTTRVMRKAASFVVVSHAQRIVPSSLVPRPFLQGRGKERG